MDRETRSRHVAEEIRAVLARRRISGKEMASALGLSQFAMSRRLRGETPFSLDELDAVARHLGVPVSSLITDPAEPAAS
jgi:transcriptional regulator with XRE-family HTH domain